MKTKYIFRPFCTLPVSKPAKSVPITGVWYLAFTIPRDLNIRPSEAIAYIIRGKGNIAPNKLKN